MKKIPLLPGYFRWIGIGLIFLSFVFYLLMQWSESNAFFMDTFVIYSDIPLNSEIVFMKMKRMEMSLTLLLVLLMGGLACIAFARTKIDDEMINHIRLYSWMWSVIAMIGLGIIFSLFIFGLTYLSFALFFGHVFLVLFIVIFYTNYFRLARGGGAE